jgi:hypothetical protein
MEKISLEFVSAATIKNFPTWSTGTAITHCINLIAAKQHNITLEAAWELLKQPDPIPPIDVESRAVAALEQIMFESSIEAGTAGDEQWGLDVGPHQNGWRPYDTSHWCAAEYIIPTPGDVSFSLF